MISEYGIKYSPEVLIQPYKDRFFTWEKEGFIGCDKSMIPLLKELNSLPGIATSFCCEGNHEDALTDRFYVMFVANEEGYLSLSKIFDDLCILLLQKGIFWVYRPELLSCIMLESVVDLTFSKSYKAFVIHYANYQHKRKYMEKSKFINAFISVTRKHKKSIIKHKNV